MIGDSVSSVGGRWDDAVDVVVVGSGAAGLTAAVAAADGRAAVALLERTERIGGTTAVSSGGVWVPANPHMRELGIDDSREDALAYIRAASAMGASEEDLFEVFVDAALEACAFLETHTPLRLVPSRLFSDYLGDCPGHRKAGRTLECVPFAAREALGEWDGAIRSGPYHHQRLTIDEIVGAGGEGPLAALARERARSGVRTMGEGLIAALLRGALDSGVDVRPATRAVRLVVEDGAVVGLIAEHAGGEVAIAARGGVVLAAGGFEWNAELVRTFLGVPQVWPLTPPGNEGDGLVMALAAGATLANMTMSWSHPVSSDGRSEYEGRSSPLEDTPRQQAGCIVVNRHGRRFTNEGVSYMDFGRMHRAYDPLTRTYPNAPPVWAIFDQRVRERVRIGDLEPGRPRPNWVHEAPSIAQLAALIGVDGAALAAEIERFNDDVARGVDSAFRRGTIWIEAFPRGGPDPASLLAPIDQPPYFATAIYDGSKGTAGGVRIDAHARVRAARGGVIPGLYAAGNTAASIFGEGYPAGGATLGPAVAFGYLAGRHAASRREPATPPD